MSGKAGAAATLALGAWLALALVASPARGWSNGVDGPDSFGTHDWILKKAVTAAAEDADWVRLRVALKATDDPDTADGIDHASGTWWHVYDRWGEEYGGADEAARVWFQRLHRRLDGGRPRAASKALGYLAHIVGDVANPMHTDSSDKEDGIHSSYEQAVDRRLHRFRHDGHDRATPASRARAVARQAHKAYWRLVNAYDENGYNKRVHRITKRQLVRAANAVADLIQS